MGRAAACVRLGALVMRDPLGLLLGCLFLPLAVIGWMGFSLVGIRLAMMLGAPQPLVHPFACIFGLWALLSAPIPFIALARARRREALFFLAGSLVLLSASS